MPLCVYYLRTTVFLQYMAVFINFKSIQDAAVLWRLLADIASHSLEEKRNVSEKSS